ncbi:MAG: hypothetical protein AAGB15_06770 [Pseudomonadota bacterium]
MPAPIHFTPDAQPWFCWFVGVFIGLFGGAFIFLGFDALSYAPLTGGGQVVFGLMVLIMAWRVGFYYRRIVFGLTDTAILERPFWGLPRTTPFDKIAGFGVYDQANKARVFSADGRSHRTGHIVTSQHLVCEMISGKVRTITLPGFENATLLQELKNRSGKPIEVLPAREAG